MGCDYDGNYEIYLPRENDHSNDDFRSKTLTGVDFNCVFLLLLLNSSNYPFVRWTFVNSSFLLNEFVSRVYGQTRTVPEWNWVPLMYSDLEGSHLVHSCNNHFHNDNNNNKILHQLSSSQLLHIPSKLLPPQQRIESIKQQICEDVFSKPFRSEVHSTESEQKSFSVKLSHFVLSCRRIFSFQQTSDRTMKLFVLM